MTNSKWEIKLIENYLRKLPKIEDRQDKKKLFELIQKRLQHPQVKASKKKRNKFLPFVATAAVFFIISLIIPSFFSEKDMAIKEVGDKASMLITPEMKPNYKYFIDELDFEMSYQQLIETLGEPIDIINIEDENLIHTKGYFMTAVYDHYELLMYNSHFESEFTIEKSSVVQVDIVKPVDNDLTIKIGEEIKGEAELKRFPISSEEAKLIYDFSGIKAYHDLDVKDVYFLDGGYSPSGLPVVVAIFVDENQLVKRIIIGLATAG